MEEDSSPATFGEDVLLKWKVSESTTSPILVTVNSTVTVHTADGHLIHSFPSVTKEVTTPGDGQSNWHKFYHHIGCSELYSLPVPPHTIQLVVEAQSNDGQLTTMCFSQVALHTLPLNVRQSTVRPLLRSGTIAKELSKTFQSRFSLECVLSL